VNSTRRSWTLLCMLALLVAPVAAQESDEQRLPLNNIRVTIRYDTVDADGKKMSKTREVVAQEGSRSRLLIGSRVPIPVSEGSREEDGGVAPVRTYAYQNIGFSAEIRAWILPNGKIGLEAEIESSQVSPETASDEHPVILTYQQNVQVVLENGKPMNVTRVEDPERVNGRFEIEAEIIK
jgi:hypothetical protein